MKKSKIKLIAILAALLLVLVCFASCKNKETNGEDEVTGNSSVVIEEIEDDATESLTSDEMEELESAWSEIVSNGDALELVPVTSNNSSTTSSDVSSAASSVPASSSSQESTTTPPEETEEPDNNNTSSSSGNGWYPGDWEF